MKKSDLEIGGEIPGENPLTDQPDDTPRCELCVFAQRERVAPNSIETALICKRLPPTPVMVGLQGPHGTSMQLMSFHPPVTPTSFCHEYQERQSDDEHAEAPNRND